MKKFLLALGICGIIIGGCVNDPTLSDEVPTDFNTDTETEVTVDSSTETVVEVVTATDTETSTVVE